MASKTEFLAAMAALYAAFPAFKGASHGGLTTEGVYWELLQDVPGDLLAAAARECATSCRYFPTVAELREAARGIACGAGLSRPVLTPEEAYEAVARYLANPDLEDPPPRVAMRALSFVGGTWEWRHTERPGLLRRDFMDAYRAFSAAEQRDAGLLPSTRELQRRLSIQRAQEEAERYLLPGGDGDVETG